MITELVPIGAGIYSNSHKRMSFGTPEMCLTNQGLKDKKSLSQKLIVRYSSFYAFLGLKWCVITDVCGTGLTFLLKSC